MRGGGGGGGPNSQKAHDVVTMSLRRTRRRIDVISTSCAHKVFNKSVPNPSQTITFLILKSDIIENSGMELSGTVLPVPSNQIKVTLLLFYPSTWYICNFFLFHIEIEGKGGWNIGGGTGKGVQRVCWPPPLKLLPAPPPAPPPPLPSPMNSLSFRKTPTHFFLI